MTTIPNEINTMKDPIDKARGDVLTYGLGLGYYVYMVANKDEVRSITAVENDDEIIALFRQHILPQFSHPEKVIIVRDDAKVTRKPRQPKPTAEDIGRSIGDALIATVSNLLAMSTKRVFRRSYRRIHRQRISYHLYQML